MITESVASVYFRTAQRWVDETLETQFQNSQYLGTFFSTTQNGQELVCIKKTAFSSFVVPRIVSEKK